EKANRQFVSGNVFSVFGLHPRLGRLLEPSDDMKPDAHPVAVLSHAYWTSRFARDPKVLDRKIRIGEQLYQIVGIGPPGFTGTETGFITAVFIPTMMNAKSLVEGPDWQWFRTWVRPRPGREIGGIREHLQAVYTADLQERVQKNRNPLVPVERTERI